MIIGRQKEKETLQQYYQSKKFEFVVENAVNGDDLFKI
jgi:hypothetical protein